jgi:hypothetical protein
MAKKKERREKKKQLGDRKHNNSKEGAVCATHGRGSNTQRKIIFKSKEKKEGPKEKTR